MASDGSAEAWVDLVCPICFDLGFADTSLRGLSSESTTVATHPSAGSTGHGDDLSKREFKEDQESRDSLGEVATAPQQSDIGGSRDPDASRSDSAPAGLASPRGNPLVHSGPMRHADDGRLENIYILPIDLNAVDSTVKGLLLDNLDPKPGDEAWALAFTKAQLIKNMLIPFKYWLEQPCPAHRRNEGKDPPCVVIRRGFHEHLLATSPDYVAKQDLLENLGYVEQASPVSYRIGHPAINPTYPPEESKTMVHATGWSVEGFFLDGGDRNPASLDLC